MLNNVIFTMSNALRRLGLDFHEECHPAVQRMKREINELGSIQFKIDVHPDGSWTAESANIEGIITGSRDIKETNHLIKDAIFTYFGIPPHLCDDKLLRANNEPVTVEQRVWATR